MDRRIDAIDNRLTSKFNTVIVVIATTNVAIVGALIVMALRI